MTAEQIKAEREECGGNPTNERYWLSEIAYQLAVQNERNAAIDLCNLKLDAEDAARHAEVNRALLERIDTLAARLDSLNAGPPAPMWPLSTVTVRPDPPHSPAVGTTAEQSTSKPEESQ